MGTPYIGVTTEQIFRVDVAVIGHNERPLHICIILDTCADLATGEIWKLGHYHIIRTEEINAFMTSALADGTQTADVGVLDEISRPQKGVEQIEREDGMEPYILVTGSVSPSKHLYLHKDYGFSLPAAFHNFALVGSESNVNVL
eukprot:Gb_19160 [translate_table: standard]